MVSSDIVDLLGSADQPPAPVVVPKAKVQADRLHQMTVCGENRSIT
jgi:hypothetical protein